MPKTNPGNPFSGKAGQHLRALPRAEAARRRRLQQQGPRFVTSLLGEFPRRLATFPPLQQKLLWTMIKDGIIEALLYHGEIYISWSEIEGFVGPGYDYCDWLRDAAAPSSAAEPSLAPVPIAKS